MNVCTQGCAHGFLQALHGLQALLRRLKSCAHGFLQALHGLQALERSVVAHDPTCSRENGDGITNDTSLNEQMRGVSHLTKWNFACINENSTLIYPCTSCVEGFRGRGDARFVTHLLCEVQQSMDSMGMEESFPSHREGFPRWPYALELLQCEVGNATAQLQ